MFRLFKLPTSQPTGTRTFFTVVKQYQRAVKLNLGKFHSTLEPGLRLNLPFYHRIIRVDMREQVRNLPQQSLISRDNVTFYVDASVQYRIVDAEKAVLNVDDLGQNLLERCQMQMRNTLSCLEINQILHDLQGVSKQFLDSLDKLEQDWGVRVSLIQLRDIQFDETMKRAMAVKAEADRNAEAKIINAKADVETAKQYQQASKIYSENPVTLRLREFQLWSSVSKNPANTIYVVPSSIADVVGQKTAVQPSDNSPTNSPSYQHPLTPEQMEKLGQIIRHLAEMEESSGCGETHGSLLAFKD